VVRFDQYGHWLREGRPIVIAERRDAAQLLGCRGEPEVCRFQPLACGGEAADGFARRTDHFVERNGAIVCGNLRFRTGPVNAHAGRYAEAFDAHFPRLVVKAHGALCVRSPRKLDERQRQVTKHERAVGLAGSCGDVRPIDENIEQFAGREAALSRGGVQAGPSGWRRDKDKGLQVRTGWGDNNLETHASGRSSIES
jgi:hypothetical protein